MKEALAVTTVDEAMGRYAQGEAAAFEVVYEAVAPRLDRFLRRHLREKAAIEDVIQQTFLQMHGARGSFIIGAEVMPWAFAIARRLMIDSGRKLRREESYEMDGDELAARQSGGGSVLASVQASAEEMIHAREAGARLSVAYARLSEPQRNAFDLVKSEGLSHAEAATILGTTVTGIKLRVHRAYLALRGAIGDPSRKAAPPRAESAGRAGAAAARKLSPLEERR